MVELPPLSWIKRMPVITLVTLTRMCVTACIQRNCLEHALSDLIEELDIEDVLRVKPQLDRSEGILQRIIEKRVRWGDWPTGPVDPAKNHEFEPTEDSYNV